MVDNLIFVLFTCETNLEKEHSVTQGFSNLAPFIGQPLEKSNSFASGIAAPAATSTSKVANLL